MTLWICRKCDRRNWAHVEWCPRRSEPRPVVTEKKPSDVPVVERL